MAISPCFPEHQYLHMNSPNLVLAPPTKANVSNTLGQQNPRRGCSWSHVLDEAPDCGTMSWPCGDETALAFWSSGSRRGDRPSQHTETRTTVSKPPMQSSSAFYRAPAQVRSRGEGEAGGASQVRGQRVTAVARLQWAGTAELLHCDSMGSQCRLERRRGLALCSFPGHRDSDLCPSVYGSAPLPVGWVTSPWDRPPWQGGWGDGKGS